MFSSEYRTVGGRAFVIDSCPTLDHRSARERARTARRRALSRSDFKRLAPDRAAYPGTRPPLPRSTPQVSQRIRRLRPTSWSIVSMLPSSGGALRDLRLMASNLFEVTGLMIEGLRKDRRPLSHRSPTASY